MINEYILASNNYEKFNSPIAEHKGDNYTCSYRKFIQDLKGDMFAIVIDCYKINEYLNCRGRVQFLSNGNLFLVEKLFDESENIKNIEKLYINVFKELECEYYNKY